MILMEMELRNMVKKPLNQVNAKRKKDMNLIKLLGDLTNREAAMKRFSTYKKTVCSKIKNDIFKKKGDKIIKTLRNSDKMAIESEKLKRAATKIQKSQVMAEARFTELLKKIPGLNLPPNALFPSNITLQNIQNSQGGGNGKPNNKGNGKPNNSNNVSNLSKYIDSKNYSKYVTTVVNQLAKEEFNEVIESNVSNWDQEIATSVFFRLYKSKLKQAFGVKNSNSITVTSHPILVYLVDESQYTSRNSIESTTKCFIKSIKSIIDKQLKSPNFLKISSQVGINNNFEYRANKIRKQLKDTKEHTKKVSNQAVKMLENRRAAVQKARKRNTSAADRIKANIQKRRMNIIRKRHEVKRRLASKRVKQRKANALRVKRGKRAPTVGESLKKLFK